MRRTKKLIPVFTITIVTMFTALPIICAKPTLFTNAVVYTVSGPTHSPGFVLIEGDTIKAVGPVKEQPAPEGTQVVNLKGQHLFPGLIAPTTALGLMEIPAVRVMVDTW